MMRGNSNELSSANKRSTHNGIMSSGEKGTRKVFTAGNNTKSNGNLPPTHPKGFGATSSI